ncbi:MAG: hypothetical protein ACRCR8_05770 [Snodgrassella alvi]
MAHPFTNLDSLSEPFAAKLAHPIAMLPTSVGKVWFWAGVTLFSQASIAAAVSPIAAKILFDRHNKADRIICDINGRKVDFGCVFMVISPVCINVVSIKL